MNLTFERTDCFSATVALKTRITRSKEQTAPVEPIHFFGGEAKRAGFPISGRGEPWPSSDSVGVLGTLDPNIGVHGEAC